MCCVDEIYVLVQSCDAIHYATKESKGASTLRGRRSLLWLELVGWWAKI
jgi:hypothetical protein